MNGTVTVTVSSAKRGVVEEATYDMLGVRELKYVEHQVGVKFAVRDVLTIRVDFDPALVEKTA